MCMQIEIKYNGFPSLKKYTSFPLFYLISSTDIYHTKKDIINEVSLEMIFFYTISLQMINHKKIMNNMVTFVFFLHNFTPNDKA